MRKSYIVIIIIVVLVAATGASFFAHPNQNAQNAPRAPAPFPSFSLRDYSGKVVESAQFRGKPLVVNSWASWCPFCKAELPALANAQDEFKDQVVIIAIDRGEPRDVAKRYSDLQGVTERLVFLLDPTDSFYKSIGGFSMPETIFVDKNGTVQYHKRGPMDIQEIRERIKPLLSS